MESKSTIIAFTVGIIFIGLFIWGGIGNRETGTSTQRTSTSTAFASGLTASETFYDFGTISMKNGNVMKEFTVTNTTDQDINVLTVLTSCMCTTAFVVEPSGSIKGPFRMPGMGYVPPANERIASGESRVIRVVYDPNAHGPAGVGKINRTVTLTNAAGAVLELEIQALVTP